MNNSTLSLGFLMLIIFIHRGSLLTISEPKTLVIQTESGLVRGDVVRAPNGRLVDTFLGIPYAEPPLGQLRFRLARPAPHWEGVFEATTKSLDCIQVKIPPVELMKKFGFMKPFTEDCLRLNIWVPQVKRNKEKIPVVVFIHPGAFSAGGSSAPLFDGSAIASEENVIVVSFNYRVASLGFLFLDDPEAPGNMGLVDQVTAIQWFKTNIANFGGDPDSLTLMGQSSGAASVIYHHLSPLSKHLFKRAIVQSGVPSYAYAYSDKEVMLKRAEALGQNLGCPTTKNITEFMRCLREADPEDLINSEPRPEGNEGDIIIFTPVLDGYFLNDSPFELLKQKAFKEAELLIGTNRDEGSLFLIIFNPFIFSPFRLQAPITTDHIYESFKGKLAFSKGGKELIENFYFDPEYSVSTNVTGAIDVVTDIVFSCPTNEWSRQMTELKKPVYRYFYTHKPAKFLNTDSEKWIGAFHGAEMMFSFGDPIINPEQYTEEEITFSRQIMRYWMNFARTGNPNISPNGASLQPPHWPKFTKKNQEYLVLAPNSSTVGTNFRYKKCRFVTKTLPQLTISNKQGRTCFE